MFQIKEQHKIGGGGVGGNTNEIEVTCLDKKFKSTITKC